MKSRESLIRLKRFQVDERRRQVADIQMMISEFERMAGDLDQQIVAEQERSGIADVKHFAYPTFAKAAIQRRDNLLASAADLRVKLERASDELAEAYEDLKRVELIEEREVERERVAGAMREQASLDEVALVMHRQG